MLCKRIAAPFMLAVALAFAASPASAQRAAPPASLDSPAPLQPGDAFGEEVTLPQRTMIYLRGHSNWDAAFDTLVDAFKSLSEYLDKQGIKPTGAAMTIYTATDDKGFSFEAAMPIASLEPALYRIERPIPLLDSTHGTMMHFELVTVRLCDSDSDRDSDSAALHALIGQGLRNVLLGADPDAIEALSQKMWWRLHYGGRGGSVSLAVSACDIALWERRLDMPLWRLLAGFDPAVPCYAGGIDLEFTLTTPFHSEAQRRRLRVCDTSP